MKKVWITTFSLVILGFSFWVLIRGNKSRQDPSFVTLPDGATIRIVGVTYGTNHIFETRLQHFAASLPIPLLNFMRDHFNLRLNRAVIRTTLKPQLEVWIEQRTNTISSITSTNIYLSADLGDSNHYTAGSGARSVFPQLAGMPMTYPLDFDVFPRRGKILTLNVFEHGRTDGSVRSLGSLSFINPVYQTYPQWQPENFPVTKPAGDLEVTLQNVETGQDLNLTSPLVKDGRLVTSYGTARKGGRNGTAVYLNFHPLRNTNEIWKLVGINVSDATGNNAHSSTIIRNSNDASFMFMPSLWPDEAAWKIKLEVKRITGLLSEEVITFKNIPLGQKDQTKSIGWVTNVNGVAIILVSFQRETTAKDGRSSSEAAKLRLALSGFGTENQFDLLRMVWDTGITNSPDGWGTRGNERDYYFSKIPEAAKTADFIFALQKVRTVEFTVKPRLPDAHLAGTNGGY